jgi:tRNA (adenine37-N6)-methyltransferase
VKFEAEPVAWVESTRKEPIDDDWSSVASSIVLDESFDEAALQGIEDFSHIEITFFFHRVDPAKLERGARHPRGNPDWPLTGIFAQRAKNRPNRIGHTTCRLVKREGRRLHVVDLDCIDGTPVLDIKPSVHEFRPQGAYRQARWVGQLMLEYWKVHGLPSQGPVDYEGLKAAFSVLPKPQWVYGDSFDIDMDEVGVQRLIDSDPDALLDSDFWGYVDTCVPGCMEDMRYLLPPMLRIWEQSLYEPEDVFAYHFHNKLFELDIFGKNLHGGLERAVTGFMRRALEERVARESSVGTESVKPIRSWIANFNALAGFTYSFPELWNAVWAAEERGHAVAVLQYVSELVSEEDAESVHAKRGRSGAGEWLSIHGVNFDREGAGWLSGNMEFLASTLHGFERTCWRVENW